MAFGSGFGLRFLCLGWEPLSTPEGAVAASPSSPGRGRGHGLMVR